MPLDRQRVATRIFLSIVLLLSIIPLYAFAAPENSAVLPAGEQSVRVEVTQPTPSITPDDPLSVSVAVTTAAPAEYLEVRVRLRNPAGRLVYQKTEVRTDLAAGTHVIGYEHDTVPLDLPQGRYPIEIRVLASGADPVTATSRLLVVAKDARPVRVAVVVVPTYAPVVTMAGRFTHDPAIDTDLRDDLAFLTQLALSRSEPLELALPPVLTEQLARAAAGYETTTTVRVPATDEQPMRHARTLESLRSAIETGTISLVDVPYSLPDLAGLSAIRSTSDLALHFGQTDAVNALALHASPEPAVAYLGPRLSADAMTVLAERGATCVLAHADDVRSGDATATPGCYTVAGSATKVLVVDEAAARGAHDGAAAFYDALFDRIGEGPVVVLLRVGPDAPNTTLDVQHALDWIDEASWLRASDVASLTRSADPRPATLVRPAKETIDTSYWAEIATSRTATLAYAGAVGLEDPDALAAVRSLLVAESSLLTQTKASQGAPAEGLVRAAEARDFVMSQFALVRLDAKDVTLSASKGNVPLTLINDTGKKMALTLHAASDSGSSSAGSQDVVVQPAQNFLTLPVDLGNALADELVVTVRAGDLTVAEATVAVQASYIDRLATVLMVVIVLAVLLVIIRRRVNRPIADTADTIVEKPGRSGRSVS